MACIIDSNAVGSSPASKFSSFVSQKVGHFTGCGISATVSLGICRDSKSYFGYRRGDSTMLVLMD